MKREVSSNDETVDALNLGPFRVIYIAIGTPRVLVDSWQRTQPQNDLELSQGNYWIKKRNSNKCKKTLTDGSKSRSHRVITRFSYPVPWKSAGKIYPSAFQCILNSCSNQSLKVKNEENFSSYSF
jgi:hypothetical protein